MTGQSSLQSLRQSDPALRQDGLARAKDEGKTLGRPRIDDGIETAIRKALKKGDRGIRKVAAELGVGVGTVQRVKAEMGVAA